MPQKGNMLHRQGSHEASFSGIIATVSKLYIYNNCDSKFRMSPARKLHAWHGDIYTQTKEAQRQNVLEKVV